MNFFAGYLTYIAVKGLGFIISRLPIKTSLALGRFAGTVAYYLDRKHKSLAYANLKIAFAKTKKPSEIKRIVKRLFKNYAQNVIELLRLPLIHAQGVEKFVKVEGKEYVYESLKKQKGVILLAMHFGSWELSSLMGTMLKCPYKVIVKPQNRFSRLDSLLNSYRQCGGSAVVTRGLGTREIIESLRKNEVIGMVVDQGGRDGVPVKFFGRLASMSVGAIRIGLKFGAPICFSIIVRDKGPHHRLIINPPLELINTGDLEKDIAGNLNKIVKIMEEYIERYPSEYVWFYKIWKYSKESTTVILNDGKAGHLRQSQSVTRALEAALLERGIQSHIVTVDVQFKSKFLQKLLSVLSLCAYPLFYRGRLRYLKWFLTKQSFRQIASMKADFVVSCGSAVAYVNLILSSDNLAKNISILKPGFLSFRRFNLVVLPQHDYMSLKSGRENVVATSGAPNLIADGYLKEQVNFLSERFPDLRHSSKLKIGMLLGGDTKSYFLKEVQIKMAMNQIKEGCEKLDADLLITTSRRTPLAIEDIVRKAMKDYSRCRMMILANRGNIPEAVGGILGLCDIVVISGDSISMISEAASSGKSTVVFPAHKKRRLFGSYKHDVFLNSLNAQGNIFLSDEKDISRFICEIARNKIRTKPLNDYNRILESVRMVI